MGCGSISVDLSQAFRASTALLPATASLVAPHAGAWIDPNPDLLQLVLDRRESAGSPRSAWHRSDTRTATSALPVRSPMQRGSRG